MTDIICKQWNNRYRDGSSGIDASEYNILIKLIGIGHNSHGERDNHNAVQIDSLSPVFVRHVPHQGRRDQFHDNVESNDKGVLEVFDVFAFIDVVLLLEEHGLEGINTDEDKAQHKVVNKAADVVAGGDVLV